MVARPLNAKGGGRTDDDRSLKERLAEYRTSQVPGQSKKAPFDAVMKHAGKKKGGRDAKVGNKSGGGSMMSLFSSSSKPPEKEIVHYENGKIPPKKEQTPPKKIPQIKARCWRGSELTSYDLTRLLRRPLL